MEFATYKVTLSDHENYPVEYRIKIAEEAIRQWETELKLLKEKKKEDDKLKLIGKCFYSKSGKEEDLYYIYAVYDGYIKVQQHTLTRVDSKSTTASKISVYYKSVKDYSFEDMTEISSDMLKKTLEEWHEFLKGEVK